MTDKYRRALMSAVSTLVLAVPAARAADVSLNESAQPCSSLPSSGEVNGPPRANGRSRARPQTLAPKSEISATARAEVRGGGREYPVSS
jgi:hypothetical protein